MIASPLSPGMTAIMEEIEASDYPATMALFMIGMMSSVIAEKTGSEHFMALMRMIVRLDDQDRASRKKQDTDEIVAMMAMIEARYMETMQ